MTIHQLIADVEAWNCYAARMNAKALAAGLVSEEELVVNRTCSQYHLDRLLGRLTKEKGQAARGLPGPTRSHIATEVADADN